jgi:uncharacterized protein (TIRG00374 family)
MVEPQTRPLAALTRVPLIGGLALFAILVWRVGPDLIGGLLLKVGWALPFVFLPHACVTTLEASGWWFTFSQHGCPIRFVDILRFSVAAKAVQLVTPSISQAGELVKIHLLRLTGVRGDISTASVVAAKTMITISELLFIGTGLVVALSYVTIEPLLATSVGIGILMMGLFVAGLLVWQRIGFFRPLIWASRRLSVLKKFMARHEAFLSSTDSILKAYLCDRRRCCLSCLAYFLGWVAGVIEAWVFLSMLELPHDLLSALVVQVWLVIVTRLTAFVPANLGTHEAGIVVIFAFLGLAPESAMVFALLRRVRQIGWIAAGLGLLAKVPRAQHARLFS